MDLRTILLFAAERNPTSVALANNAVRLTYHELSEHVIALADSLRAQGVQHGDRVAMGMRNSIDLATVFLATQAIGAVAVPFNYRNKPEGIARILADCSPRAVVVDESVEVNQLRSFECIDVPLWVGAGKEPELAIRMDELIRAGTPTVHGDVHPDDLSVILYTSGTTGSPKGVPLTQRNNYARLVSYIASAGPFFDSGVRTMGAAPMYHTVGLHWVFCLTLFLNGTYYPITEFDGSSVLDLIYREELTFLFGSPTLFHMLLKSRTSGDRVCDSVTDVAFGSAPMDAGVLQEMSRLFPHATINEVYGTTELSIPFVTRNAPAAKASALRPTADHRIRVVAPMGGPDDTVSLGEVGELLVDSRNAACFGGYWNAPEKTKTRLLDGWFRTGDAFYHDGRGNYFMTGRLDDMFISGGENIQPAEVEAVLLSHPAISDVAVVGTPEPRWGDVVTAFIVSDDPSLSPVQIERHCLNSALADFKRPRRVVFLNKIPRNPSGKIVRRQVQELYRSELVSSERSL